MKQKILNIVARFPGCSHDSFIWRSSNLRLALEQGNLIHGTGWLLGDSGYPNEPWLHTPILDAVDDSEESRYNSMHAKGRSVIERCNGTLKARFRCLLKHRTLHYAPTMAAKIINSCAILHNICIDSKLEWEDLSEIEDDDLPFNTGNCLD